MSEHDDQAALFAMIDLHSERYPALKNVFAIPNGGARTARTGARLKAEGVRAGVPDVFVAVPAKAMRVWLGIELDEVASYAGLFIEMKYGRNRPDEKQDEWLGRLAQAGYKVLVCYNWEQAWQAIVDYLGIDVKEVEG